MARIIGQIIARCDRRWLIQVYLGGSRNQEAQLLQDAAIAADRAVRCRPRGAARSFTSQGLDIRVCPQRPATGVPTSRPSDSILTYTRTVYRSITVCRSLRCSTSIEADPSVPGSGNPYRCPADSCRRAYK